MIWLEKSADANQNPHLTYQKSESLPINMWSPSRISELPDPILDEDVDTVG